MITHYRSRGAVAYAAKRAGIAAFESLPFPGEKGRWKMEQREPCAALEYGLVYAQGKDWVSHVEVTEDRQPVLVVTVPMLEIFDEIPKAFQVRPVTPSLWDKQAPAGSTEAKAALTAPSGGAPVASRPDAPARPPRTAPAGTTKKGLTLALMQREGGVTLDELHETHGGSLASVKALVGDVKRMGYTINFTNGAYVVTTAPIATGD